MQICMQSMHHTHCVSFPCKQYKEGLGKHISCEFALRVHVIHSSYLCPPNSTRKDLEEPLQDALLSCEFA